MHLYSILYLPRRYLDEGVVQRKGHVKAPFASQADGIQKIHLYKHYLQFPPSETMRKQVLLLIASSLQYFVMEAFSNGASVPSSENGCVEWSHGTKFLAEWQVLPCTVTISEVFFSCFPKETPLWCCPWQELKAKTSNHWWGQGSKPRRAWSDRSYQWQVLRSRHWSDTEWLAVSETCCTDLQVAGKPKQTMKRRQGWHWPAT